MYVSYFTILNALELCIHRCKYHIGSSVILCNVYFDFRRFSVLFFTFFFGYCDECRPTFEVKIACFPIHAHKKWNLDFTHSEWTKSINGQ